MVRIVGVNIPDNKQIKYALTYIYGIGLSSSEKVLSETKIDSLRKASDLKTEELNLLKEIIEKNYKIEGNLKRKIMLEVKRLKDIGSWRGSRHTKKLTVRGQRTKTNSRTVRGNARRTVGSGKKLAPSPK